MHKQTFQKYLYFLLEQAVLHLDFTEGEFLKANTCAPMLYLPLSHSDYETFKEKCDFGFSIRHTLDMRNIRFLLVSCH